MAAVVRALNDAGIPATDAASGIWDLARAIGAPTCLADVGFDFGSVEEATDVIVAGRPINPRVVDEAGVGALLTAACHGERPGGAK
jgi:alcohol dehydrogenase class IV